jgi:hypothetical protein
MARVMLKHPKTIFADRSATPNFSGTIVKELKVKAEICGSSVEYVQSG